MAKARVAINGFGRIGRLVVRNSVNNPNFEVVAVNDLANLEVMAYMFKYDSAFGPFDGTVEVVDGNMVINGKEIRFTAERDPANLPWKKLEIDYAVECTGIFIDAGNPDKDPRKHIAAGAKRVICSAPAKTEDVVKTVVMGVNHTEYDPAVHTVVSNASCTTNCLAPVVKVVSDNFGIENGLMTTIHAVTASQPTVDISRGGFDPLKVRSSRAAGINIIPASTGAAAAIGLVMPEVRGKLTGMAFRVPTITGSAVDLTVLLQKDTNLEEISNKLEAAANLPLEDGGMKGILRFTKDPIVSTDIIGERHSSIFDYHACIAFPDNKRFFKLVSWYDNEFGYANRVVDLLGYVAGREA
jgi:glyceraldehyde 3-phosphate dehydrogenase